MPHRNQLQAIILEKCPRCRQGDMFAYPLYQVTKFDKMHKTCPHCNFVFDREPGFFDGAMYVSYVLSVGLFLSVGLVLYVVFGNPETWVYITTVVVLNILLIPSFFRYSRVLYLYLFGSVKYQRRFSD